MCTFRQTATSANAHHSNDMILDHSLPLAPDWLVGLWRRDSITLSDGAVDRTTRVFWAQTKTLYVDIRLPADRPNLGGVKSLSQLKLDDALCLSGQQGFAGHIVVDDSTCTWIRTIDYQPETGRPDTGCLRLDGDLLRETGNASSAIGSDYEEVYYRELRGDGLRAAFRLVGAEDRDFGGEAAQGAILVILDDRFLFARPRPIPLPRANRLRDLIDAAGDDSAIIHAYLDCEVAMGSIVKPRPWTIHLSTVPLREGGRLFAPAHVTIDDHTNSLHLASSRGTSQWHIAESIVPLGALAAVFET